LTDRGGLAPSVKVLCESCRQSLDGKFGRYRELFRGALPPESRLYLPPAVLARIDAGGRNDGADRRGRRGTHGATPLPRPQRDAEAELACVVDVAPERAQVAAQTYRRRPSPNVAAAVDRVDAAIIAVPTARHVAEARPFVAAGKSVLIEKPLAPAAPRPRSCSPGRDHRRRRPGRAHGAVQSGRRGPRPLEIVPKFIEADRISPFTFRSADVGVVLDLMIHDIDLVLMMVGSEPARVDAVGVTILAGTRTSPTPASPSPTAAWPT